MKVRLITPHPGARNPWAFNSHIGTVHISASLPFATRGPGLYIHRVRSAAMHFWKGEYSHTYFKFWCGACAERVLAPEKPRTGGRRADLPLLDPIPKPQTKYLSASSEEVAYLSGV